MVTNPVLAQAWLTFPNRYSNKDDLDGAIVRDKTPVKRFSEAVQKLYNDQSGLQFFYTNNTAKNNWVEINLPKAPKK
jgi:hypothetical protein